MNEFELQTLNNAIALFEEIKLNAEYPPTLLAWFEDNENLINQTIFELKEMIDEYEGNDA